MTTPGVTDQAVVRPGLRNLQLQIVGGFVFSHYESWNSGFASHSQLVAILEAEM